MCCKMSCGTRTQARWKEEPVPGAACLLLDFTAFSSQELYSPGFLGRFKHHEGSILT